MPTIVRTSASELARDFANKFLAEGSFVDTGAPMSMRPMAASTRRIFEGDGAGFAGLSVQAVGYAEGPIAQSDDNVEVVDEADTSDEVHIHVTRGSKKELSNLPSKVGNISVFVHNTGKATVKPVAASASTNSGNLYEHNGRLACGSSCAPADKGYAGTFGALVRKRNGRSLYALSNNHIFSDCNHLSLGMPIQAPAGRDSKPAPARPPGAFCENSEMLELRSGCPVVVPRCRADLAIAKISNPDDVSSWQGDAGEGFDTPTATREPQRRLKVKKFGRSTGLTHGIIVSRIVEFDLPYESENFSSLVWFEDVWSIQSTDSEPFALTGDSGSLVVTEDESAVVGVLFAVLPKGLWAYIVPVGSVTEAFGGIEFVGDHGV